MFNKDFPFGVGMAELGLMVSMGSVPGYSHIDKFGYNSEIGTSTYPEDVWGNGGLYTYSTTADIVSLSSSNDTDDQVVRVTGLTLDGVEVVQDITLTGQTVVALTTPLWRVYRMTNVGDTSFAGTIYCFADTTVTDGVPSGDSVIKASIDNGNNQTLMALYTVPKGKIGFLMRGEIGVEYDSSHVTSTAYAKCCYKSKRLDGVTKIKKVVTLSTVGSSNYVDKRTAPDIIPSLTDIALCVEEVSETMGVWGAFDVLLVDEDKFSLEYLQAIEQPGY